MLNYITVISFQNHQAGLPYTVKESVCANSNCKFLHLWIISGQVMEPVWAIQDRNICLSVDGGKGCVCVCASIIHIY